MSFYLGSEPVPQAILRKESTTLTAGQTVISTGGYTDGDLIQVSLNGVILEGSGVDYTATNGSDITLTVAGSAGDVLQFQTFDAFELVGSKFSAPTITNNVTLKNDTEEDTDGGRSSKLVYKGEQSGGEISTLAEIEASHDGNLDDEKGSLVFKTNDGNDGSNLTEAMRLDSNKALLLGTSETPSSTDVKQVISASSGAFTQFSVNGGAGSAIGSPAASQMALYTTTGNVGSESYQERLRIDDNGAVGIGVTPATIGSVAASLQLNDTFLIHYTDNTTSLSNNVYWNGSNNIALTTGTSSQYYQNSGEHIWRNAASASAGATATLTERMKIDSSGRVTMPNQPGFQADRNFGWRDYSSYTVVPTWRTTSAGQFNIGNHFNHNTGVFTCPVAGRYLINISAYVNNDNDYANSGRIGRNGSYWGDNLITYQSNDTNYPDNTTSASYIMNASANDTIEYYHQGDIYGYHTSWSIYLLG